jgi:geranylgeranyl diphosphate synthase type II
MHEEFGIPTAINVGDGMLALGLGPLLQNIQTIGLGPALKILEEFKRLAVTSAQGQMVEIDWIRERRWDLTDADYIEMVRAKTGTYSFVSPLRIGGIAAGATEPVLAKLARFGDALGVAFQIVDDLLSITALESGKDRLGDLWEGKRTLLVLGALNNSSPSERIEMTARLERAQTPTEPWKQEVFELVARSSPELAVQLEAHWKLNRAKSQEDVERLEHWLRQRGGLEHARSHARHYIGLAGEVLLELEDALEPSEPLRFLSELIPFVTSKDPEFDTRTSRPSTPRA